MQSLVALCLLGAAGCWANDYPPPPGPYSQPDVRPSVSSTEHDPVTQVPSVPPRFRDPIVDPVDTPPDAEPSSPMAASAPTEQPPAATATSQPPSPARPAPPPIAAPFTAPPVTAQPTPPPVAAPLWPPVRRPAIPPLRYRAMPPPPPRYGLGFPAYSAAPYRPAPARAATGERSQPPQPQPSDGAAALEPRQPVAEATDLERAPQVRNPDQPDTTAASNARRDQVQFSGGASRQFRPPDLKGTP